MDGVFHHAEDVQILAKGDADLFVERIRRFEPDAVWSTPVAGSFVPSPKV